MSGPEFEQMFGLVHLASSIEMCHILDSCLGVTPCGRDAFIACERNSLTCSWSSSQSRSRVMLSSSDDELSSSESLSDIYRGASMFVDLVLAAKRPSHSFSHIH